MTSITVCAAWRTLCRTISSVLIVAVLLVVVKTETSSTSTPPFRGWLVLDGVDDYAEAQDDTELDVGDGVGESLTVEAWVNFQSFYRANIIYKPDAYFLFGDLSFDARCIGFHLWSAPGQVCGHIHCRWPGPSLGWHHVAGVFRRDTGEMRMYLDGEDFGADYCATINNSNESLKVGRGWWTGVLRGGVDEVRISDVARYTGSTYTVPASPFTCDGSTRALWHFDEQEGATVFHDTCGVNNLLTGRNGAHTQGVPVSRIYLPLILK